MKSENRQNLSQTTEMIIGKNKYIVTTHYKENGRETAEQKLLRFVSDRITGELKNSAPLISELSL